jgi:peptidyl-dipeptidase A
LPAGTKSSREALINRQMKVASREDRPSCRSASSSDQWRWGVFSGRISTEKVQRSLVGPAPQVPGRRCAGRRAPRQTSTRAPKYHVPGNTPYTRYFLSFVLQFQFQRALCEKAASGPDECSISQQGAGRAYRNARWRSNPGRSAREADRQRRWTRACRISSRYAWLDEQNAAGCGWTKKH